MKITSINRRMPLSETLQRVGSTDSKAFGRTSRTYRKGGLMFTITASQSEWSEFDTNGHLHRMEMIIDHLSDEDAALLYRSEASISRGVAAVNAFLKKLDEAQEAEEAKARKAKAEKAAAEEAAAMEAAESARQQKLAEMVATMLQQQYGLKPVAQQNTAVEAAAANVADAPTTPQTTAPAPTTTAATTADQQQQFAAIAEFLKQNYGLTPTISAQNATAPATPQQATPAQATPPTPPATPQQAAPADDKSKGSKKK